MSSDDNRPSRTAAPSAASIALVAVCMTLIGATALLTSAETLLFPDLPPARLADLAPRLLTSLLAYLPLAVPVAAALAIARRLLRARARRGPTQPEATGLTLSVVLPPIVVLWFGQRLTTVEMIGATLLAVALAIASGLVLARMRTTVVALAHVVVTLVLALLAPSLASRTAVPGKPLPSADGQRVVILGLDGATWSIVDPMIARGELPVLEGLRERGASGPLRSLEPTLSNRVWTSAATGVTPDRHGITDFFFDRRLIRVPTIWDLVHTNGGRVGIFEYLVTEPPLEVNGFSLPGWWANNPTSTHPPGLVRRVRLLASVHHPWTVARYALHRLTPDPRTGQRARMQSTLKATAFTVLHQRYRPDLATCIWYGTDRLGHKMWRYFEPGSFADANGADGGRERDRYRDTIPRYYRAADAALGRVIETLDDGRTIFIVMSDHGMGPTDSVRITGYSRGARLLAALGLDDDVYVENPHAEMFLNCRMEGRTDPWTVAPEEQASVIERVAERITSVVRTDTGEPIFEVEVGDLTKVDLKVRVRNPETLSERTPVRIDERTRPAEEIIQLVEVSGTHRIDGILLIVGPGVRAGARLENAVITDVAPTALRALGLPIAEDLDGRFLEDAFESRWRASFEARTVPTFGTTGDSLVVPVTPSEDLIEQLRSLGYIN